MQGQYGGVCPAEVSVSPGQPTPAPGATGSVPAGMGAARDVPVLGGAECQCLVPGGDSGSSAITPNVSFLLLPLPGQVAKLQQLSGHTLPFASLGHAPSMVPGEHLLCPPHPGLGAWGAPPDPPSHLALMRGSPSPAPSPVPAPQHGSLLPKITLSWIGWGPCTHQSPSTLQWVCTGTKLQLVSLSYPPCLSPGILQVCPQGHCPS